MTERIHLCLPWELDRRSLKLLPGIYGSIEVLYSGQEPRPSSYSDRLHLTFERTIEAAPRTAYTVLGWRDR